MARANIETTDTLEIGRGKINTMTTELYSGTIVFTNGLRMGAMSGTFTNSGLYLGYLAGTTSAFVTSRGGNIGIGTSALAAIVDGAAVFNSSFNTVVGYEALMTATSPHDATAMGARSQKYVTGPRNTTFGSLTMSGASATTAYDNVAMGYNVLAPITTGYENVGIGSSALNSVTTGYRNTGLGLFALSKVSTGFHNVAVGSESFERADIQTQNVGVGFWSGLYVKGSNNTMVGAYSGGTTLGLPPAGTGYNMNGNAFFGVQSGVTDDNNNSSVTGTNYCTFIGYQSGGGSATQVEYSTALGYRAKVLTSRSMVFGSSVDGDRVNYGFGGESYGGGVGIAFIKSAITVPASDPVGGGILYVEAGALKYRGSSGTITVLGNA